MKKFVVLLMIFACLLITGCGSEKKKEEEKKEPEVEQKETEVKFSNEEISGENELQPLFTELNKMGTKIYDDKSYTKYEKKQGAYFISLGQLNTDFGYDISAFKGSDGTVCNKELSGIYFDTEKALGVEFGENVKPIIPSLIGCNKNELGKTQN